MRFKFKDKKISARPNWSSPILNYWQAGFAAFYITILILSIVFVIGVSVYILTYGQQKIIKEVVKSGQAYYAAEAGIEDGLLKLAKKMSWSSPFILKVENSTSTVEISNIVGGSRIITSTGNYSNRIRKLRIVYEISSKGLSFYYGAQVGEGGVEMQDSSKIDGNAFSNGSVINLSGNPEITGTIKIAKNGNRLEGLKIGKDAYTYKCLNSEILGKLVSATSTNCSANSYETLSGEIATSSLPITESQIQDWKNEAISDGTITSLVVSGKQEISLGPKKIEGNLTVQDQAKLKLTGTIWVTGQITIQNNGQIFLDNNAYGNKSGAIISDGKITVQDRAIISGSGEAGSYLMLLSTLDSVLSGQMAVVIQNSPQLDIIYAPRGRILLQDSISLREVSGWGLRLQNTAKVIYEAGLEDANFTSGPGGSWQVTDWKEVQ